MDNTREKLIELLGADVCLHSCCMACELNGDSDACIAFLKKRIADHLIANRVTFQEYDCHWATEQAYKNGYEQGKKDAVVHGRWIPGEFEGEYTCSRCGMEYCEADPRERPYKYCPECGSKNE